MTDAQYQYTFEPHGLHGSEIDGQDFPFGYITKFKGAEKIPLEIRLVLGSKQENLDVINYIIVSCNDYPKIKEQNKKLIKALRGMIRASDEFSYQAVCRGLSSDESYKECKFISEIFKNQKSSFELLKSLEEQSND